MIGQYLHRSRFKSKWHSTKNSSPKRRHSSTSYIKTHLHEWMLELHTIRFHCICPLRGERVDRAGGDHQYGDDDLEGRPSVAAAAAATTVFVRRAHCFLLPKDLSELSQQFCWARRGHGKRWFILLRRENSDRKACDGARLNTKEKSFRVLLSLQRLCKQKVTFK